MLSLRSAWKTIGDARFDAIPASLSVSYLPSLDGLRAISIIFVIVGHILYTTPYGRYISGSTGVMIFFAISGFLITTLLLKEQVTTGSFSLKRFYIRRFLRIFPVAYLFLLVLLVINQVFALHIARLDFLMAFFYVKNLMTVYDTSWQTGHFWSLAVEEQFYFVVPFLLKYHYRTYIRLIFILLLIGPPISILYYHSHITGTTGILLGIGVDLFGRGITSILFGSFCAILMFKGMIPLQVLSKYRFLAPFLVLLVAVGHFNITVGGWQSFWMYANPLLAGAAVLLSLQPGSWFYRLLNIPFLKWIGVLSYSLYIWQQLFTNHQPWAHTIPHGDAFWVNIPVLLLVACASYYLFEKKFLKLKDRFHGPAKAVRGEPAPVHSMA
ncbi:acyltransferase family protein [Dinghuibacter silviterrae]|uniref:Peptidoglycan/LPS O-acetylase OafA/YrhL n=1 Tax=Dinghuibacter silviterrae TaxID=1539049 RepID=A0A4R8DQE3_9BACT|nr:acyltransferase [Dinghuibacter silviterrae]TDW99997.1 peptidoglycan/LPS O-acetylase OafA/YrhL [Dinghuibacter silviterrae]